MDKEIKSTTLAEDVTPKTANESSKTTKRIPDAGDTVTDLAREQWRNTRDLLQKALCEWDHSEKVVEENIQDTVADQKAQKQRLENLLCLLKDKIDELSEKPSLGEKPSDSSLTPEKLSQF